jgi:hypothetical protein
VKVSITTISSGVLRTSVIVHFMRVDMGQWAQGCGDSSGVRSTSLLVHTAAVLSSSLIALYVPLDMFVYIFICLT